MPPDQVTLRQQQPLVAGMLEQTSADLTKLLQTYETDRRGSF
jgi:hypothetical protein